MSTSLSSASLPLTPPSGERRRDLSIISLIGLAHGTSHFFHMLLPPLFPAFIRDFGFSYSELGLLVTAFFVVSGVGQALAGFLVDRVGARPVLFVAIALFAAAAAAAAMAQGYSGLLLAAVLAGLGNAPFHPADFTVLNKRVSSSRLGHAFSVHGICGNLGWALAPVFLVGLSQALGSWRAALWCAAGVALVVLALLWLNRGLIDDGSGSWARNSAAAAPAGEHPMAFLRLPSVWLCFSFFFWATAALSAIQSFAGPALAHMYQLPLSATAFVVTAYMVCGAVGMIAGGFLVVRVQRLEQTIAAAMLTAAALLLLVASGVLPPLWAGLVTASAGVGVGLAGPSRDMLIKRAAPPGATGRVYGTVYSGLDIGFAVAAPLFGMLLDRGWDNAVFAGSAAALTLGVASAAWVGMTAQKSDNAGRLKGS